MSKRVLILVEGQTEERFVKEVLAPDFWPKGLYLTPTILVTKRVKDGPNFKGGVTNFAKFENDARRLLTSSGNLLVTTLLDYYGLPSDFPGMSTRPANASALDRVLHVEKSISAYFGQPANFAPFLALHEFEAWLFSSASELPRVMTEAHKQPQFEAILRSVTTPEEINERPEWAPSKRIQSLFPSYDKKVHGPNTINRIGLQKVRQQCPHLNEWLTWLEQHAVS